MVSRRIGADVPRGARRHRRRRGTGWAHRRRRAAPVRAPRRSAPRDPAHLRAAGAPSATRRAAARLPGRCGGGARLRGARGRVHPGDRRRGQAVLRLPRVPSREARVGARARPRRHDDTITHGPGVPDARSPGKVLRRRPGSAHRGRPRHGRPPRHVRPRLHGEVLRGPGLPGPRQLLGELQRPGDAVRDRAADGLGGAQLLLQHGLRREQRLRHGRALVAPRRLRPAAGDERSRLRVVCLP